MSNYWRAIIELSALRGAHLHAPCKSARNTTLAASMLGSSGNLSRVMLARSRSAPRASRGRVHARLFGEPLQGDAGPLVLLGQLRTERGDLTSSSIVDREGAGTDASTLPAKPQLVIFV